MIDLLPRRLVVGTLLAAAVVIVVGMAYVFTSRTPERASR